MNNQLFLANAVMPKLLNKIVPDRNHKKNEGEQKTDAREMKESKLPLFYTEPIFKAKKHDCL